MKKRVWELDAARGAALIGMILIHLHYDAVELFGLWDWNPGWYQLFKNNYGAVFLLISGISVTLGSHPVKRGFQVFCCGFLCTGVTVGMYLLGFAGKDILIYFGVLQCLGCCMMLWPLFRKGESRLLLILAAAMIGLGLWLRGSAFSFPWLTVLGFAPYGFASSDYFPLFPNLGYFLVGAVLGRKLYAERASRFPRENPPAKFLQWMGRNSLLIYMLHQPVLVAAVGGISMIL